MGIIKDLPFTSAALTPKIIQNHTTIARTRFNNLPVTDVNCYVMNLLISPAAACVLVPKNHVPRSQLIFRYQHIVIDTIPCLLSRCRRSVRCNARLITCPSHKIAAVYIAVYSPFRLRIWITDSRQRSSNYIPAYVIWQVTPYILYLLRRKPSVAIYPD